MENDPTTNEVLYEKNVVFYELDLGLNHVVRKWSDAVDLDVEPRWRCPGGTDGPGGVLVCSENFVMWKAQGHARPPLRAAAPCSTCPPTTACCSSRRRSTSSCDLFFLLVQSEFGDLYKVTLRQRRGGGAPPG